MFTVSRPPWLTQDVIEEDERGKRILEPWNEVKEDYFWRACDGKAPVEFRTCLDLALIEANTLRVSGEAVDQAIVFGAAVVMAGMDLLLRRPHHVVSNRINQLPRGFAEFMELSPDGHISPDEHERAAAEWIAVYRNKGLAPSEIEVKACRSELHQLLVRWATLGETRVIGLLLTALVGIGPHA